MILIPRYNATPIKPPNAGFGAALSNVSLVNGLVGYWPFLESGGLVVRDYSFVSRHMIRINSTQAWESGPNGPAFNINGANLLTSDPGVDGNSPATSSSTCTIAVLVKRTTGGAAEAIFEKRAANPALGCAWELYASAADTIHFYNGATDHDTSIPLTVGAWTQIVVTITGTTSHTVYVNGGQSTSTGAFGFGALGTGNPIVIGADVTVANFFRGLISYAAIWNRLLTPSEIQLLYVNPWCMLSRQRSSLVLPASSATVQPVVFVIT